MGVDMELFLIKGVSRLQGEIELSGAKNAALPILVGAILSNEDVILHNIPLKLKDIQLTLDIIRSIGGKVIIDNKRVIINGKGISNFRLPADSSSKIRSSLIFLGALLSKIGKAEIPFPGGCSIGERKFDLHIDGIKALGAEVSINDSIKAEITRQLKGATFDFYLPTTTGTQNVILAALTAEGRTVLRNANTRPENQDFINFLNQMGAKIKLSNRYLEVEGVTGLHGTEYSVMCGSDEMITYIVMAAVTGGEIKIKGGTLKYIPTSLRHLRESGMEIFEWGESVYVSAKDKVLKPIDIATAPYPGINSDLQPLFSVYAAACNGESTITDMRFTDRFQYVDELKKFGIDIEAYGNCAVVKGAKKTTACSVKATDLRGGAALIAAALMSEGDSHISNIYQIDRGYEEIEKKLEKLGAKIQRINRC